MPVSGLELSGDETAKDPSQENPTIEAAAAPAPDPLAESSPDAPQEAADEFPPPEPVFEDAIVAAAEPAPEESSSEEPAPAEPEVAEDVPPAEDMIGTAAAPAPDPLAESSPESPQEDADEFPPPEAVVEDAIEAAEDEGAGVGAVSCCLDLEAVVGVSGGASPADPLALLAVVRRRDRGQRPAQRYARQIGRSGPGPQNHKFQFPEGLVLMQLGLF